MPKNTPAAENPDPLETCACVCGCAARAVYAELRLCAACGDLNQNDRRRGLTENYTPEAEARERASRQASLPMQRN